MRVAILFTALVLAGCGERVRDDHFSSTATETAQPVPAAPEVAGTPVRVGELGSNFAACNAVGATRRVAAGEGLTVRNAPFDGAEQVGEVAPGARFFVCTTSHDQRWSGIVWDEASGALDARCGVSAPLPGRQDYAGPCRSGWVQSSSVRLVAS